MAETQTKRTGERIFEDGENMTVAAFIARFLHEKGIRDVFGLSGWGSMKLSDELNTAMKFWCSRNEAAAPVMSSGYYKSTGRIALVNCTAGPGAANCVPGLAEAYVDGSPMLILSGQVATQHMNHHRSFGTAGMDIINTVRHLTKFCATVQKPEHIRYYLEKAYWCMLRQYPGPVWLDIPIDVQNAEVPEQMDGFTPPVETPLVPTPEQIKQVVELLNQAKSPLILVGHGVKISGAEPELKRLIQRLIPFVTTRFMTSFLPYSHPLNLGLVGIKGRKYCKAVMQSADVILVLGSTLPPPVIGQDGEFIKPGTKLIRVDVTDPGVDFIKADLKLFLQQLPTHQIRPAPEHWVQYCQEVKEKHGQFVTPDMSQSPMDLYRFITKLDEHVTENCILTSEAGGNYYSSGQVFTFEKCKTELTSVSFAAMGTSIPLAIGAAVGNPDKTICCVVGDGGLELNIQELKTISFSQLNIKVFVIENAGYNSMRHWQKDYFDGRLIEKERQNSLNLEAVARAFDLKYCKLNEYAKLDEHLTNILSVPGPLFIEVTCDPAQKIIQPLDTVPLFSVE